MKKKRSIHSITYTNYGSSTSIRFNRRNKENKLQSRRVIPSDQDVDRLVRRVNHALTYNEGDVYVWCTGWTFYPKGVLVSG